MKPLYLIAAMCQNQVIGYKGDLPWKIREDLAYFKKVTIRHPIIMGRNTFESVRSPLPERHNIVLTTKKDLISARPDLSIVSSLEEAIECAGLSSPHVPFIIGGAQIYQQSLPFVTRMYLTIIDQAFTGDAYFPKFAEDGWYLSSETPSKLHEFLKFQVWDRKILSEKSNEEV